MPWGRWTKVGFVTVLVALLLTHQAVAFIQKLFPLQEFIDDSDFLFTAKVERVDPNKPSAVLVLGEHLKGKAPFTRIPINLTGDKQKHTPQLLKRIAMDLPLVVGIRWNGASPFRWSLTISTAEGLAASSFSIVAVNR